MQHAQMCYVLALPIPRTLSYLNEHHRGFEKLWIFDGRRETEKMLRVLREDRSSLDRRLCKSVPSDGNDVSLCEFM